MANKTPQLTLSDLDPSPIKEKAHSRALSIFQNPFRGHEMHWSTEKKEMMIAARRKLDSKVTYILGKDFFSAANPRLRRIIHECRHPNVLRDAFTLARSILNSKKWSKKSLSILKLAKLTYKLLKKNPKSDKVLGINTLKRLIRPLFPENIPRGIRKKKPTKR